MNARPHVWLIRLGGIVLLCTLWGCSAHKPSGESRERPESTRLLAHNLSEAAWQTYRNARGMQSTEDGIPSEYWAGPIKALHPIKVYTHRVNIVVVQRVDEGIEEGKYIYIPISSYLPYSGDDGFEFTPARRRGDTHAVGDGVFDFKRTISKQ